MAKIIRGLVIILTISLGIAIYTERRPEVDRLIQELRDEDSRVRASAAEELGKIRDSRAVTPLIAALRDRDSDVRWRAGEALSRITGKDFGEDPVRWQK